MDINRAFWELPEWWRDADRDDARWSEWHHARATALGAKYDEDLADDHVAFFESLALSDGKWAGGTMVLMPWQEHLIIRPLFGYLKATGLRLFQTVFVAIPKKNGKSGLASGLALDLLWFDGEAAATVIGAANDREQASLVFDPAAAMTEDTPALSKRLEVIPSKKRIVHAKSRSKYMAVAADSRGRGKHGSNTHGLICDELHAIEDREYLEVLELGAGDAREQPVFFFITTAGSNQVTVCFEKWDYARQVRDGIISDTSFLPVIFELDPEEDWEDEANWYKCNPGLGVTIDIEKVRLQYERAKEQPAQLNKFLQLRLNRWVSQETRWLPMDKWDACGPQTDDGRPVIDLRELAKDRDRLIEEVRDEQAIGWIDLSSSEDLTTFGLLYPPKSDGDKFRLLPWFFMPRDNLEAKSRKDKALYQQWADHGFIELTDGNVVDYLAVRRRINWCREHGFKFREIPADDWNLGHLAQELELDGFTVIDWPQTVKHMGPGTKLLLEKTLDGSIDHAGNPVLRYNADNLAVKMDHNERAVPVKGKSSGRIDGVVGAIMALSRWIEQTEPQQSVYESDDFVV